MIISPTTRICSLYHSQHRQHSAVQYSTRQYVEHHAIPQVMFQTCSSGLCCISERKSVSTPTRNSNSSLCLCISLPLSLHRSTPSSSESRLKGNHTLRVACELVCVSYTTGKMETDRGQQQADGNPTNLRLVHIYASFAYGFLEASKLCDASVSVLSVTFRNECRGCSRKCHTIARLAHGNNSSSQDGITGGRKSNTRRCSLGDIRRFPTVMTVGSF